MISRSGGDGVRRAPVLPLVVLPIRTGGRSVKDAMLLARAGRLLRSEPGFKHGKRASPSAPMRLHQGAASGGCPRGAGPWG